LTIFKAPYSVTNKNTLTKRDVNNDKGKVYYNEFIYSPENMEIIMEDVLALLNINISYKERLAQINDYTNKIGDNFKKLILTVSSSSLFYTQDTYVITPLGLKNSKRKGKDGIVLFGYEKKVNKHEKKNSHTYMNENEKSNLISDLSEDFTFNDFYFPIEESKDNSGLYEFPNFAIYYNLEDENYYIKDFNTGVGALMKIKNFQMEKNTLINIGSNYLVVYINKNVITIKIFNNSTIVDTKDSNEKFGDNFVLKEFQIKNNKNNIITIGRSQKCDIIIEDMMLSKVQCYIKYNSLNETFYLIDGYEEKESTNGTWVFIQTPIKITNNFLFKAEHTLFITTLSENK